MKIFITLISNSSLLCAFALAVLCPNFIVVICRECIRSSCSFPSCWPISFDSLLRKHGYNGTHSLTFIWNSGVFFQQIIVDAGMSKTFCIIVVAVFSVFFFLSIPFNCSWLATHLCILFVNKLLKSYRRPADIWKVFNSINFN